MDFPNSFIWTDTAGWVMSRDSAAQEKLPYEAVSWKTDSRRKSSRQLAPTRSYSAGVFWHPGVRTDALIGCCQVLQSQKFGEILGCGLGNFFQCYAFQFGKLFGHCSNVAWLSPIMAVFLKWLGCGVGF